MEPQTYSMVSSLIPESLRQFLRVSGTLNGLQVYWDPRLPSGGLLSSGDRKITLRDVRVMLEKQQLI